MIYMDNAATSWPKPKTVRTAINEALDHAGNPGRGTHSYTVWSSMKLNEVRQKLAKLFCIKNSQRIAFTSNATHALNIAVNLCYGQIVTTAMEHNSVLRPVATRGYYHVNEADANGSLDYDRIRRSITELTGAVVMTHASNVTGEVYDVARIGEYCRKKGILFIVDCAQSAGVVPIDVESMCIDVLCFTGHKGLFGIQGTGGIYVADHVRIRPYMSGGTGSHSFLLRQPTEMPDCFEAGTVNTHGIAALGAGLDYFSGIGVGKMQEIHTELWRYFTANARKINGITVYGPEDAGGGMINTGVVSLNVIGHEPGEVSMLLGKEGICTRAGYHCAPLAHKALRTDALGGTVRFSFSHLNTKEEIDTTLYTLKKLFALS